MDKNNFLQKLAEKCPLSFWELASNWNWFHLINQDTYEYEIIRKCFLECVDLASCTPGISLELMLKIQRHKMNMGDAA